MHPGNYFLRGNKETKKKKSTLGEVLFAEIECSVGADSLVGSALTYGAVVRQV